MTRSAIRLGPDHLVDVARRRLNRDEEHLIQSAVFAWALSDPVLAAHPELAALYAIPNWFGVGTARQGARAKREGRRKNFPDVCLPAPRGGFAALYIETKTPDGRVRPGQRAWADTLTALGNRVVVCRSFDEARAALLSYLALPATVAARPAA